MYSMSDLLITIPMVELPDSFVNSLKQLFNILCDGNSNIILLEDLEHQCKRDDDRLPNDVVLALRGLTHNGEIDFDKFVSAIRIASSTQMESQDYKTLYGDQHREAKTYENGVPVKRSSYSNFRKRENSNNKPIYKNDEYKEKSENIEPFKIHPPISPILKNISSNNKTKMCYNPTIKLGHLAYSMPNLDQIDKKQNVFEKGDNYVPYRFVFIII